MNPQVQSQPIQILNTRTNQWENAPQTISAEYAQQWDEHRRRSIPYTPTSTPNTMPNDATEYTRLQPRAAANADNLVHIPGIIASFIGVLSWPVFTGVLHSMEIDTFYSFPMACALTAVTFAINVDRSKNLLYVAETATNHDINGDGFVGEPEYIEESAETPEIVEPQIVDRKPREIKITISRNEGRNLHFVDVEISRSLEDKLPAVARAIGLGVSFSRPQLVDNRGLITQAEFHELKAILLDNEFAERAGNRTIVTPAGREFLSSFSAE